MKRGVRTSPIRKSPHRIGKLLDISIARAGLARDRFWVCHLCKVGRALVAEDCGLSSYRARIKARVLRTQMGFFGEDEVKIVRPLKTTVTP